MRGHALAFVEDANIRVHENVGDHIHLNRLDSDTYQASGCSKQQGQHCPLLRNGNLGLPAPSSFGTALSTPCTCRALILPWTGPSPHSGCTEHTRDRVWTMALHQYASQDRKK